MWDWECIWANKKGRICAVSQIKKQRKLQLIKLSETDCGCCNTILAALCSFIYLFCSLLTTHTHIAHVNLTQSFGSFLFQSIRHFIAGQFLLNFMDAPDRIINSILRHKRSKRNPCSCPKSIAGFKRFSNRFMRLVIDKVHAMRTTYAVCVIAMLRIRRVCVQFFLVVLKSNK